MTSALATPKAAAPATVWHSCYEDGWRDFITKASFAHPAKFSRKLIERIYDHMLAQGWLEIGDLVADPFGGIGLGGLIGAYRGLRWVGVELEPRFIGFAKANFHLHAQKLTYLGRPVPKIIQGDSRRFAELVGHVCAVVSSPPYADTTEGNKHCGIDWQKAAPTMKGSGRHQAPGASASEEYGSAPGQIGRLKPGPVEAVITSPPFTQGYQSGGGINKNGYSGKHLFGKGRCGNPDDVGKRSYQGRGGDRVEGNIETLKEGSIDGVVTSPPFEDSPNAFGQGKSIDVATYGDSAGQIGHETKESYWQAMREVYAQCFLALKPGGYMAVVVKNYVKDKQIVPLCDDTLKLLEFLGFELIERVHAMLVHETRHGDLFNGETRTKKERKSFFRRLAEKKGSPKIDFEEVLFCRKPNLTSNPQPQEPMTEPNNNKTAVNPAMLSRA